MNDSHYCPHTPEEMREMLSVIGVASVEELFAPIPAALRAKTFNIPAGMSEFETFGRMQAIAGENRQGHGEPPGHRQTQVHQIPECRIGDQRVHDLPECPAKRRLLISGDDRLPIRNVRRRLLWAERRIVFHGFAEYSSRR